MSSNFGNHRSRPVLPPRNVTTISMSVPAVLPDDLLHLANLSNLALSLRGQALSDMAERISMLVFMMASGHIALFEIPSMEAGLRWAKSLSCVMQDAVMALTGEADPGELLAESYDQNRNLRLISEGGFSGLLDPQQKARFAKLLTLAGLIYSPKDLIRKTLRDVLLKGAFLISAIAILADGVSRISPEPRVEPPPEEPGDMSSLWVEFDGPRSLRRSVFDGLAPIFEALHHGRKFAVSKYGAGGSNMRQTRTGGPAIIWTRELFRLIADRTAPLDGAASSAFGTQMAKLYAWAVDTPEGFAKCIEIAGRKHRENQQQKMTREDP
jgi:hypothetical protein